MINQNLKILHTASFFSFFKSEVSGLNKLSELERNLRMEKVVTSKQLRLAVEIEEERRARVENDAAIIRLRLAMEMDEERKQDWRRW